MNKPNFTLFGPSILPYKTTKWGGIERIINLLEQDQTLQNNWNVAVSNDNYLQHHGKPARGGIIDYYNYYQYLKTEIIKHQPTIANTSTPLTTLATTRQGIPTIQTVHQSHWQYQTIPKKTRDKLGYFLIDRPVGNHAIKQTDVILCYSNAQANIIKAHMNPKHHNKIYHMPQPISPVEINRSVYTKELFEQQQVTGVGTITPRKNWLPLAAACQQLNKSLTIVGPIIDQDYANQLRSVNPSITLTGEVARERLLAEVDAASIIVHPSLGEVGSCLAVLESMARSKPIIASPSVKENIDGNGVVMSQVNQKEIAKILASLDYQTCKDWARQSHHLATTKYSLAAHGANMHTIATELLTNEVRGRGL